MEWRFQINLLNEFESIFLSSVITVKSAAKLIIFVGTNGCPLGVCTSSTDRQCRLLSWYYQEIKKKDTSYAKEDRYIRALYHDELPATPLGDPNRDDDRT